MASSTMNAPGAASMENEPTAPPTAVVTPMAIAQTRPAVETPHQVAGRSDWHHHQGADQQ